MSEVTDLVLPILRDLQSRLTRIEHKVDDAVERVTQASNGIIATKKDNIFQDESIAHIQLRQDRLEAAVDRINTRLGLVEVQG
jgi:hypothetical protein